MTTAAEKRQKRIEAQIGPINTALVTLRKEIAGGKPSGTSEKDWNTRIELALSTENLLAGLEKELQDVDGKVFGESEASNLKGEILGANSADDLVKCARQIHPGLNAPMLENELRAQVNKLIGFSTVTIDNLRTAGLDTKYYAEKEKELKQKEIADADKEIGALLRGGVLAEAHVNTILEKFNVDASLKTKYEQSLEDKLLSDQLAGGKGYAYDSIAKLPVRSETLAKLKQQRGEILTKDYIDNSVKIFTIPAINADSLKGLVDAIPEGLSNENVQKLADAVNAKLRELLAGKTADEKEKYYLDCSDKGIDARYWDTAAKEFRTNRESTEQTAIKKEIANEIKFSLSGPDAARKVGDITKRIEIIGGSQELIDLLKAKMREYYDLKTDGIRANFIAELNNLTVPGRFIDELKQYHESKLLFLNISKIDGNDLRLDAANWVGTDGRPVDIYNKIVSLGKDSKILDELIGKLQMEYRSLSNDKRRSEFIEKMKAVGPVPVHSDIQGPLIKLWEETSKNINKERVDDYLAKGISGSIGIDGDFRKASHKFADMMDLAILIEGDKVAEDKLKKAVSEYYGTLISAKDRSDFVTEARGKGLGKYINDELWKSTLKDVEASKETIESVMPILADYVDKALNGGIPNTAPATIEAYFKSDVMPAIVNELRTGIPVAAEQELLAEFTKAVQHGEKSNDYLGKIQTLRKDLVGTIIPQMFPIFGLSPYEQYSGIAPATHPVASLVDASGVLSLTALKTHISTEVNGPIGISNTSREFPFIVQTITETVYTECMAELHDAKEIKKKEDEVDAILEKKKKKERAKKVNGLKWFVGLAGAGALFGSGLGFIAGGSNLGVTGSSMLGSSFGGLVAVGKGLYEWFDNSDVKKLDSEWKMARAEFEIQKSKAVMSSQKREMQAGNHFEGVLRDVFYPAQKKGREALFGRSAKMRQDMVNMPPVKFATMTL
jgi:hypothetical protein